MKDKILEILMRYQNPIPVGMDTSKGSIELDHNETVDQLLSLFYTEQEAQRLSTIEMVKGYKCGKHKKLISKLENLKI